MIIDNYYSREKAFLEMMKEKDMWKWSMEPHKADEIIFAEIMNAEHGTDSPLVSASYYCMATPLSEKDVDNLLFINSGLFTYDGWEDDVVEFVIGLLMKGDRENVYPELKEVIAKKKFNPFFRKKCQELCNAAVSTKIGTIKARKDTLTGILYQTFLKIQEMGEKTKHGYEINRVRSGMENTFNAIYPELEKFEKEINGFGNLVVRLNERLDWKALMIMGNLSKEYLERRRKLWENEDNVHR